MKIDTMTLRGEEYILIPKKYYNENILNKDNEVINAYKATDNLTLSEYEAIEKLINEFKGNRSIINLTEISNKYGITKTLLSKALDKLKISGVITTAGRGSMGTDITILNSELLSIFK